MEVSEEDGLTPEKSLEGPSSRGWRPLLFLIPFLLFPVLLFTLALNIIPTQWFIMRSGNTYLANVGYADKLHNSDCKVVVYGDSSALTSVDPLIIERRTGLKTCNIAEFEGATAVSGTILVDHYLAHNPRPEYLLFMFNPENLGIPPTWRAVSYFEAVTYRARGGLDGATLKLFASHPVDMMNWSEQGLRMSALRLRAPVMSEDRLHVREPSQGMLHVEGVVEKGCDPTLHELEPDRQWLQNIRQKYGVGGTKVIIDVTPAPPCDPNLNFFQARLPGLVDDIPWPIYPVNVYIKGQRNHMNEVGSAMISNMMASQILGQPYPASYVDGTTAGAHATPSEGH